jgi:hypothetical protein
MKIDKGNYKKGQGVTIFNPKRFIYIVDAM